MSVKFQINILEILLFKEDEKKKNVTLGPSKWEISS